MSKLKKFTAVQQSRGIQSIYEGLGEENDDMNTISRPSSKRGWWTVGVILFFVMLMGAAWSGYSIFSPTKAFQPEKVTIKIDGPRIVSSSEEVTYLLTYKNTDANPMTNVMITTEYPQEFTIISADPATDTEHDNRWQLGLLKSGESGIIQIKGQWRGNQGDQRELKASINYTPANFNSPFIQEDVMSVTIEKSLLHSSIEGPTEINPGDDAHYEITYYDFSDIYKKDTVQLIVDLPVGFTIDQTTPQIDEDNSWSSATLLGNIDSTSKQGHLKIDGKFDSESKHGTTDLMIRWGFNQDGHFTMENEERFSTEVSQGDLVMQFRINKAQGTTTVNQGDMLNVLINYENQGKYTLTDVSVDAMLDGLFINWSAIQNIGTGTFSHETLEWSSNRTSALKQIKPGDTGQLSFRVPVHSRDAIQNLIKSGLLDSTAEFSFTGFAHATYHVTPYVGAGSTGETLEIKTGKVKVLVNSDLAIKVEARYFSDSQSPIGSGPLPPIIGQMTTYVLIWEITNSFHDLDQVRITTVLPSDVEWVGQERMDMGTIAYDTATRTVSWTIDHVSSNTPVLDAQFSLSITPTAFYAQKLMTLTSDTGISAQDSVNQSKVSLKRPPLTTNLDFDPVGNGKGLVQP
ncbi:MAG: hypothetical protein Q8P11_00695 [bacterium]|nr:hypothetical protein [bacterium]